ncbi:hypothetical protein D9758_012693 [Tetrapyrgos nigripes]|uniref:mRNA export factor GLE1 n=1 Tax=Tetrapyrgos nigripes TaxID=182062 RepID=A0A8H5CW31_9AGAR|nr:hypothetical protein D9758_012693 [Tetrapyrgos nigripes]
MRFSAPRSVSPSPTRRHRPKSKRKAESPNTTRRNASTFGLNSPSDNEDSDEEDYEYDESAPSDSDYDTDSVSSEASSSDSFCYGSESEVPVRAPRPSKLPSRPPHEQRYIEDTVAAIRSRLRHNDPYEDWEREMKKDSLRLARKEHNVSQAKLRQSQTLEQAEDLKKRQELHDQQQLEISGMLEKMRLNHQQAEKLLREKWQQREKALWERIEKGIKLDEDKVRAKLEEERWIREEAERKRREQEEKRLAEEKKKKEEEEKKQREEEEERKRVQEEKETREREAREKAERLAAEANQRREVGLTTAEEDWAEARKSLHILKTQGTKFVKARQELKSMWGAARRQITPKVGQVTNDIATINRVSSELVQILLPPNPHPPEVYNALLSSLAKAFLLQAETEVTAEKKSVIPLAQVAFNCLGTLQGLPEVFFAKINQRIGGWAIPIELPGKDWNGRPWADDAERLKASGRREREGEAIYTERVMGVMRLYFAILMIKPQRPLKSMWQLPRCWTWFARLMSERRLLESVTGAQVLYVALDVVGKDAKLIWGVQFVKLLALIYEGTTTGLGNGKLIGGPKPEGIAARGRVQLEIEAIMNG